MEEKGLGKGKKAKSRDGKLSELHHSSVGTGAAGKKEDAKGEWEKRTLPLDSLVPRNSSFLAVKLQVFKDS